MTRHQLLILQRHLRNAIRGYNADLGRYQADDTIREAIWSANCEASEILAHVEELMRLPPEKSGDAL